MGETCVFVTIIHVQVYVYSKMHCAVWLRIVDFIVCN
jgi:hypothetical protein